MSILILLSLISAPVEARDTDILCRLKGRMVSATTENGRQDCKENISMGEACFIGQRALAIRLLTSDIFNWDEEWIENAHFKGRDEISYEYVDGPNDLRLKHSMRRCR